MIYLLWLLNQMELMLPYLEQLAKLLERYEHLLLRVFCYATAITSAVVFFFQVIINKLFG